MQGPSRSPSTRAGSSRLPSGRTEIWTARTHPARCPRRGPSTRRRAARRRRRLDCGSGSRPYGRIAHALSPQVSPAAHVCLPQCIRWECGCSECHRHRSYVPEARQQACVLRLIVCCLPRIVSFCLLADLGTRDGVGWGMRAPSDPRRQVIGALGVVARRGDSKGASRLVGPTFVATLAGGGGGWVGLAARQRCAVGTRNVELRRLEVVKPCRDVALHCKARWRSVFGTISALNQPPTHSRTSPGLQWVHKQACLFVYP